MSLLNAPDGNPAGRTPPRYTPPSRDAFERPEDVLRKRLLDVQARLQLAEQTIFEQAATIARLNSEINLLYDQYQQPAPQ